MKPLRKIEKLNGRVFPTLDKVLGKGICLGGNVREDVWVTRRQPSEHLEGYLSRPREQLE